MIAKDFDTALIPLDDFFSADIPDDEWDEFTVEEKLKKVFDWDRLRHRVVEPLLAGKTARWRAFDFASGLRADGTYGMEDDHKKRESAEVILVEGAYSAGPQLADLVDLAILVDVPAEERHERLKAREEWGFLQSWHERWDEVEAHYFTQVKPRRSFDLIVSGE